MRRRMPHKDGSEADGIPTTTSHGEATALLGKHAARHRRLLLVATRFFLACGVLVGLVHVFRHWAIIAVIAMVGPKDDGSSSSLSSRPTQPFPRWTNGATPIYFQNLLDTALFNKDKAEFQMIHLIDASYQVYTLLANETLATPPNARDEHFFVPTRPSHMRRAQVALQSLLVPAVEWIQRHPLDYPYVTERLQRSNTSQSAIVVLAHYDDTQMCNNTHAIFTLSAPLECPTAWPVPNYALVPLAKALQKRSRRRRSIKSRIMGWVDSSRISNKKRQAWLSLIPQVIWRGCPTGSPDVGQNSRIQLCLEALQHYPHLVDAKIACDQPSVHRLKDLPSNLSRAITVSRRSNFTQHRAVLDMDGNSWSSRFAGLLCAGTQVVVKVQPHDVDYFYPTVQSGVHYWPVYANLSNLQEQATRAVSNVDASLQMMVNAQEWCLQHLTLSNLVQDMAQILEQYASLIVDDDDDSKHANEETDAHGAPATLNRLHEIAKEMDRTGRPQNNFANATAA